MPNRVVITGLGVIHALGESAEVFFDSLIAGKSGLKRIERFDPAELNCQVACEHTAFKPEEHMDPKEARRSDRFVQFAVAASKKAVADAKLDVSTVNSDRFGVIIGSGVGGLATIEEQVQNCYTKGPRKVSPFTIPMLINNMASGVVAIQVGARGPNFAVVSACASGTNAIGECWKLLRDGEVDVMISGGTEAAITPVSMAGFCSMKAMATDFNAEPTKASRPFDVARCGFVMGEGAGVLVMETLEHAKARGAKIYAEIVGYGASCDAFHITQPDTEGKGLKACMIKSLQSGGVRPEQVGYINAHGTSTPYNDKFETLAIKSVFGEHAKKVKISSTKSMTGHCWELPAVSKLLLLLWLCTLARFLPPLTWITKTLSATSIILLTRR